MEYVVQLREQLWRVFMAASVGVVMLFQKLPSRQKIAVVALSALVIRPKIAVVIWLLLDVTSIIPITSFLFGP